MRSIKKIFIGLLFAWVVSVSLSCNKIEKQEIHTIIVASARGSFIVNDYYGGDITHPYYLVKFSDSDSWQRINRIEGFLYEPGFEYQLKIEVLEWDLKSAVAGAPVDEMRYVLLEIVSKELKHSENLPKDIAIYPE